MAKKPIDLAGIFRFDRDLRHAAKWAVLGCLFCAELPLHAQVLRYPVGVGATPFALASDYRALGWNPAGLTHAPLNPDRTWIMGSLEGGFSLESSVFERSDLWDDLLNRENSDENWTGMGSQAWLDALSDQHFSAHGEVLVAGTARRSKNGNWGLGYAARQSFVSEAFLGRSTLDLLTAGGAATFFEQVILSSGDTVANPGNWTWDELSQVIGGVDENGDAWVGEVLGDTRLGFSWQKSHELGISKRWGREDGWQVHTGIGAKLLLGNGYFRLERRDGVVDAFGAFSNGFEIPRLDSVSLSPTLAGLRSWGPVGQGWGIDLGVVLVHPQGHWFSGSVTDMGWMEWRGERYRVDLPVPNLSQLSAPNAIMDLMVRAMNPTTWFQEAQEETRRVNLPTAVHLGAGTRLGEMVWLAGDMSFDRGRALGSQTVRMGASGVLQLTSWLRVDGGIRKLHNSNMRVPIGFTAALGKKHFEVGARAGDLQALWKPSQPEVAAYLCVARWVF